MKIEIIKDERTNSYTVITEDGKRASIYDNDTVAILLDEIQ